MDEGAPTTARLRRVLGRAKRVVIVDAAPQEADAPERARTVVTGDDIADLARVLAVVDGGTGDRCLCPGWPTIQVYGRFGRRIADWTLHHQTGLRGLGDCDADLQDGPALTEWLAERGLTGSREAQAQLAVEQEKQEQRRMRWIRAAPPGLAEAAAEVAVYSDDLGEAKAQLAALTRERYPEAAERILLLLAWAGVRSREPSGGSMWFDMAVLDQLLAEAPDLVLAALADRPPTPAQLDGAAELFCTFEWTKTHGRDLPEPVRSRLTAHIEADGTDPQRYRLEHGSYGAERTA
ncbi:hypothetical protein [Kitasatospora sp. NPDC051914]|uniref:hypothetical protein n=1 Tax=Kitasatospora sp. NPDC051914 TaxID=3154945 RepID=UPI0034318D13